MRIGGPENRHRNLTSDAVSAFPPKKPYKRNSAVARLTIPNHKMVTKDDGDPSKFSPPACCHGEEKVVIKYKKKNKELSEQLNSHRRAYHDLEEKYALLKLRVAEAQANEDTQRFLAQQALAERDLFVLDALNERDSLLVRIKELERQRDEAIHLLETSKTNENKVETMSAPNLQRRSRLVWSRFNKNRTQDKTNRIRTREDQILPLNCISVE